MKAFAVLLALMLPVSAATTGVEVMVGWNPWEEDEMTSPHSEPDKYLVYLWDPSPPFKAPEIIEIPATSIPAPYRIPVTIPPGGAFTWVTAVNGAGESGHEPPVWLHPGLIREAVFEESRTMKTWWPIHRLGVPAENPNNFVRVRMIEP